MVNYTKVINGLDKFINEEIINKMVGTPKTLMNVVVGVAVTRATEIFQILKGNSILKTLNLVNENDEIDVEVLYKELKKQVQKTPLIFDLKILGTITLNEQDIDKLYSYIMGG